MFDNIRKLLRRSDYDSIPLPVGIDPKIFNLIMERAISPEQQSKVLRTAYHLSELWKGGETANLLQIIVMVDTTYPHLARMADLEMFGTDWLAELAKVIELTTGSANNLVGQSEQFKQLLRDAYENVNSD